MQYQYELLIDSDRELEQLESAVLTIGASHINQEGWTTEYGGNGVRLWFTCTQPRRVINQFLTVCPQSAIVKCKKQ